MTRNDRQQRMAERILEDESLRANLEDAAATALVDWASQRAAAAAADPARPDDVVEAQVQAIRKAARAAALSGESDARRLIAVAEANLAPGVRGASDAAAAVPSIGQEQSAASGSSQPPQPAAPPADSASPASAAPANAPASRQRRKRSRLARFLKRVRDAR
ncbi:MAG TPA: hypothetical protein VKE41_19890 [Roseiflexaceae bacterium]|nr:hypothetical protein [Roseiflexaceae bacterium]